MSGRAKTRTKGKVSAPAASAVEEPIEHGYSAFSQEQRFAWTHFLKAYKVVTDEVDKSLRDQSAISLAEFEVLFKVTLAGGRIRFKDLSRIMLLSQSRISRQIEALRVKGFLRREITDSDRRATFAIITPEGQRAWDEAQEPFARAFRRNFLDIIPKSQLKSFSEVLKLLLQDFDYCVVYAETIEKARELNNS